MNEGNRERKKESRLLSFNAANHVIRDKIK